MCFMLGFAVEFVWCDLVDFDCFRILGVVGLCYLVLGFRVGGVCVCSGWVAFWFCCVVVFNDVCRGGLLCLYFGCLCVYSGVYRHTCVLM